MLHQRLTNKLAQQRPTLHFDVVPTLEFNIGPTKGVLLALQWANIWMLTGMEYVVALSQKENRKKLGEAYNIAATTIPIFGHFRSFLALGYIIGKIVGLYQFVCGSEL